jgi:hypothetical protein
MTFCPRWPLIAKAGGSRPDLEAIMLRDEEVLSPLGTPIPPLPKKPETPIQ